jgi:2-polyprenyl-6-methoxyphenol hydroxylase-like FAD-dependent oxidoreductase
MTEHTPVPEICEVLIVGMGPVGKMAALLLARQGHRVVMVERKLKSYPLPRAVAHDAEVARILQNAGMGPDTLEGISEPYDDMYVWVNREDEPIHLVDWTGIDPSGWNNTYFYHQPSLEGRLDAELAAHPTVHIRRGAVASMPSHDPDGVDIDVTDLATDTTSRLRAGYVIGADGANSSVRNRIGVQWHDLGYFFDWLVVDVLPKGETGLPHLAKQVCDWERPTTVVPGGPGRRRWEFMRLEGETNEELTDPDRIWQLLEPFNITPENGEIERGVVYTFASGWAEALRAGRVFLAGDAGHLMPPFAGQGLAAGLRDAVNLAWKLDLALTGRAGEKLLDTYGPERINHVSEFIDFSMALGRIICITDPEQARQRDERMKAELAAGTPSPPPAPRLGDGLHQGEAGGYLSRQGRITTPDNDQPRLYDDVFGPGSLILGSPELAAALTADQVQALSRLGISTTTLAGGTGTHAPGIREFHDATGVYRPWLDELGAGAVLVRPDFYVYGTASTPEQLHQLVADFTGALGTPENDTLTTSSSVDRT